MYKSLGSFDGKVMEYVTFNSMLNKVLLKDIFSFRILTKQPIPWVSLECVFAKFSIVE